MAIVIGLVAVVVSSLRGESAHAVTEPSAALPGGPLATPLNISNATQDLEGDWVAIVPAI